MRISAYRVRLAALALGVAAFPLVVHGSAPSQAATPTLSFGPAQPADPQRDQGEPNIEIDQDGRIYTCGPTGFTTGADYAQVSTDGGDQFHLLGTPPRGQMADRGGGDCYLSTGKEKNDADPPTYTLSYIGLADTDFTTGRSEDNGASFAATPTSCSGVTDRQWTTFLDDKTVFLIYNDLEPRATVVQKSVDGGLTFTGYGPCGPLAKKTAATNPDFPGPIKADPARGYVYFGYNRGNNVYLGISHDRGDTWEQCLIAETDADPSNGFVVADQDSAGNLYASWGEKSETEAEAFRAMYSWLPAAKVASCTVEDVNPGWAAPIRVDKPPVQTLVFPWLVASGAPGKVAVTWYGSTTAGVPSTTDFKGPWDVYVAQTQAAMSSSPVFEQVKATTHPMHYDQVCLSGLACVAGGDRSLADFFAMALDPTTGRLVIVYDESGKLPDGASGPVAIPHVLVQDTGTSNLGTTLAPRPDRAVVRSGSTDPTDAQAPYSISSELLPEAPPAAPRTNQPALDVTSVSVGPQVDLETGEPVVDGGFTVTMQIADLSAGNLQSALLDTTAQSLIWAFRWVNGYQPASLSVHWDPVRGFGGGFDDFTGGSVTCLGTPSTGEPGAYDPKCITYPGTTAVPMDVNADTGVIRLSAPREVLEALGAPDENGRPTVGPATAPGVSRFYGGTVFTMGNVSANEVQGFLYPVDGTAAFDFVLPGATAPGPDPSTGPSAGPTRPPTNGRPGGGGTTPSTGGLGWPVVAAGFAGVAALVALRRRRRIG